MSSCHNHTLCIEEAKADARAICASRGAKLTPQREQVLELVWQSHKPLGAYALIDMLAQATGKRVAPPTVYRALDFLLQLGLIHRIHSLNAYVGCPDPMAHKEHGATHYFLICEKCHDTEEVMQAKIAGAVDQLTNEHGFQRRQQWLEVTGVCGDCVQT